MTILRGGSPSLNTVHSHNGLFMTAKEYQLKYVSATITDCGAVFQESGEELFKEFSPQRLLYR